MSRPPVNGLAVFAALAGASAWFLCGLATKVRDPKLLLSFAIPPAMAAVFAGLGACLSFRTTRATHRRRWNWLGVLAVFLGVAPLALAVLPSVGSHDSSPREFCAGNLRQIGQAVLLYSDENGGHLPDGVEGLLTQDIVTVVFICPQTNDTPAAVGPTTRATAANVEAGGHLSYVYLGKGWTEDRETAETILAYEPLANHRNQGMNVLFGDGHVEFCGPSDAKWMLSELAAGYNPPRPPNASATQPSIRSR